MTALPADWAAALAAQGVPPAEIEAARAAARAQAAAADAAPGAPTEPANPAAWFAALRSGRP